MTRPARRRGTEIVGLLVRRLAGTPGSAGLTTLAAELAVPRSTLYAVAREMIVRGWLVQPARGRVALGPRWIDLGFPAPERAAPPHCVPAAPMPRSFLWNPELAGIVPTEAFRRPPPWRIGFSNGSRSNPWRRAMLDTMAAAVAATETIAEFTVLHADDDLELQARQVAELAGAGLDALLVSPIAERGLEAVLTHCRNRRLPVVMVDRTTADPGLHLTYVAGPDAAMGRVTAQWLVETLGGSGEVLLLPGVRDASPAMRRLEAALEVFALHPSIRIAAIIHTDWTPEGGYRAVRRQPDLLHGSRIAGVWCDSGLQGAGSLRAWIEAAARGGRPVPPHTGGDLNGIYQLALRHRVPLAAIDYPVTIGSRAVEICIDILSGRPVPRRVEIHAPVVVSRGHDTLSVRGDLALEDRVAWDRPPAVVLAPPAPGPVPSADEMAMTRLVAI